MLTWMYSLKREHREVGVLPLWEEAARLVVMQLGVDEEDDEDGVFEEAEVCMQDSTILETATSLVKPIPLCLREFLDS